VARHLAGKWPVKVALDIGCGAGLSTAALAPLASSVVGLEPEATMLTHCAKVAPGAAFVIGRAEALPFPDGSFDLVSTAGALNYADLAPSLAEVARVMAPGGLFVPYDFSAGRRLRDDDRLNAWYDDFQVRYPSPPGYPLDLRALGYAGAGLDLAGYEELEVVIPMALGEYVDYVLGESGVEYALREGRREDDIRSHCEASLRSMFSGVAREVVFEAQIAYVRSRSGRASDAMSKSGAV
jgi:SAM-dependent methyltransferase